MFKLDLTGKRYGKLTVTRFLYSRRVRSEKKLNSHTHTYWECLCDCGNITKVLTKNLHNGNTKSCGCLPNGKVTKPETPTNELYNGYICKAKNKNLEFTIPKEIFIELTKQNCFYCDCEPKQEKKTRNKMYSYIYNGLDRIDNTRGYTVDNVVPCCGTCNKMKLEMSIDEFKNKILTIKEHMKW